MAEAASVQQVWFCPACGTRLSYGIYCKTCQVETDFQMRPATDLDRLRAELHASAPVPPEAFNDYP